MRNLQKVKRRVQLATMLRNHTNLEVDEKVSSKNGGKIIRIKVRAEYVE